MALEPTDVGALVPDASLSSRCWPQVPAAPRIRAPQAPQAAYVPAHVPPQPSTGALPRVLDHDRRHTQQAPTGQLKSQAQIDIFAIHVKTFIKSTDLLVSRAAQHQKGCIDPIWLLPECQLMRAPQRCGAAGGGCRHKRS